MVVRIGLLGASRIAPKAIIAPAQASPYAAITAVASRDLARAEAYAQTHGIAVAVGDYESLVIRDDVDVVYCALPPAAHIGPCLQALAAGKALLIEKPFAMDAGQARQIADAAREAGRPALEAFHYRFHIMFQRALDFVREGRLGRLTRLEGLFEAQIAQKPGELRWDPAQGGGGTMDLGCYVLHAIRTLIGQEPQLLSAAADLVDGVDADMHAQLGFSDGLIAEMRCSMTKPRCDWLMLEGEHGALRLDRFVSPQNGGALTLSSPRGEHREEAHGLSTYDAQLAHLIDVLHGEAEPLTGGEDAVANMALIDAMRRQVGMKVG